MRMSTVREFRDHATTLLRSRSPVLIARRGRLAGIFFPALAGEVARLLRKRRVGEDEVLKGFDSWRKARRAARRRR